MVSGKHDIGKSHAFFFSCADNPKSRKRHQRVEPRDSHGYLGSVRSPGTNTLRKSLRTLSRMILI